MDNKTTPENPLKRWFEKAYGRPFSDVEVAEYKNRLVRFFEVLIEVDQRNEREKQRINNNEATTI